MTASRAARLIVSIVVLAVVAAASAWGQHQRVLGTRVLLTPPPGFTSAGQFAGFQHDSLGATIMVMEMPAAPFEEAAAIFSDTTALAAQNLTLHDTLHVGFGGRPGVLAELGQSVYGFDRYTKLIALACDADACFMAVGMYPNEEVETLSAPMRASLLSMSWQEAGQMDPFEGLAFRADVPTFFGQTKRAGPGIMMSERAGDETDGDASLLLISANGQVVADEAEGIMTSMAHQLPGIEQVEVRSYRVIEANGGEAFELTGTARDTEAQIPVLVYMTIVPQVFGYHMLFGTVASEREGEVLPVFRAVTASFETD